MVCVFASLANARYPHNHVRVARGLLCETTIAGRKAAGRGTFVAGKAYLPEDGGDPWNRQRKGRGGDDPP